MTSNRLAEFDGLRAVAILMVVIYHYFQTYTSTLPYGDRFFPWAVYGDMGVYLFFVISGFVIAFSLRSGPSFWSFMTKRFFRLWPALVVASILTFAVMHLIETPFTAENRVGIGAFLPSLTFTDREWWAPLFGIDRYVDRVYWTLALEMRFYIWAIIICTLVGTAKFSETMALFLLGTQFVTAGLAYMGFQAVSDVTYAIFISGSAHYFAAGVVLARIYANGSDQRSLALLAWAIFVAMNMAEDRAEMLVNAIIFAIMGLCVWQRPSARIFASKPLVWIGVCSYSIYLLHNYIGAAFISLLPSGLSNIAYLAAVTGIFAAILVLSWLCFILVERPSLRLLKWLQTRRTAPSASATPLPQG